MIHQHISTTVAACTQCNIWSLYSQGTVVRTSLLRAFDSEILGKTNKDKGEATTNRRKAKNPRVPAAIRPYNA